MTTHTPGTADQAQSFGAGPTGAALADIISAFSAEQAELDAAGVPGGVAAPGSPMPDGELLDVHGAPTTLAQIRAGRPAVVVFYRGAWCPYCNLALRDYQAELVPALAERGVELIAVSPQKPDGSLTMAESNKLTFSVVSDPGNQLASALGILTEPTPGAVAAQAKLGFDLVEQNADGTRTVPLPTTVVVDPEGVISWIDVQPNYAVRSEVPDILAAMDAAR